MKKHTKTLLLAIFAFCFLLSDFSLAAQTNQHYTIKFLPLSNAYTGPTNVTIDVGTLYFYMNTNATAPLITWPFFGSCPVSLMSGASSNYYAATNFGNFILMNPPVFVYAIASNAAGASFFSNLAGTIGTLANGNLQGLTTP